MELPYTAYAPRGFNGRVNPAAPESAGTGDALGNGRAADAFPGFQYQTTSEVNFQGDMLRGNQERSPLSEAYFSRENIQAIQNGIRRAVYERSQPRGYIIDNQSVDELKIIMRALFLQYAKHLPHDIAGQVAELNQYVLNWSVPHILSAVDHYQYYLTDIDTLPTPMAHPVQLSRSGTKSKPLNPFI